MEDIEDLEEQDEVETKVFGDIELCILITNNTYSSQ